MNVFCVCVCVCARARVYSCFSYPACKSYSPHFIVIRGVSGCYKRLYFRKRSFERKCILIFSKTFA